MPRGRAGCTLRGVPNMVSGYYWVIDQSERDRGPEICEYDAHCDQWWRCGAGAYDYGVCREALLIIDGPLPEPELPHV